MKKASDNLTPRQQAELKALAEMPDEEIDTSDARELPDWSGAERGLFFRPAKEQLRVGLDADVVEWFKRHATQHESYQTKMNRALRDHIRRQESGAAAAGGSTTRD